MLKALIAVRMAALKSWFFGGGRNKEAPSIGKMIGFGLLMLYSLGALGFMFWHYFSVMFEAFYPLGLEWLYYSMVSIALFAMMFLGTVFFAQAQLYEAKDNELLLSMPIKPVYILISRIFMLLVIGVFFSLPVVVSAIIVAWGYASPSLYKIFAFFAVYLLLLLLALAASAFFGWLFSIVTARVRRKALVGTLLCVAFIGGYSYFIARLNTLLLELAARAHEIAGRMGAVTPVYWLGSAIALENRQHLLLLCLIIIALFALCFAVLALTFIRTATSKRGSARVKYVEKQGKAASPERALLRREFSRFGSSSAYIMNAALGLVMMLAGAVILIIKRNDISALLSVLPGASELIAPILAASICLLCSMNLISAPSVSLEGHNIWIVQSLPVSTRSVLMAKLKVHLYLCLPVLVAVTVVCAAVLKLSLSDFALILAASASYTVFLGILGLVENLRHPNLNWTQEAQAVKSGFGLLFTMLIGWGVLSLPVAAYLLLGDFLGFAVICVTFALLLAAASVLLYKWLISKGCAIFRQL